MFSPFYGTGSACAGGKPSAAVQPQTLSSVASSTERTSLAKVMLATLQDRIKGLPGIVSCQSSQGCRPEVDAGRLREAVRQ